MQLRPVLSQAVLPSLDVVLLGLAHTGKHSITLTEKQLTVVSVYILVDLPYTLCMKALYTNSLKYDACIIVNMCGFTQN